MRLEAAIMGNLPEVMKQEGDRAAFAITSGTTKTVDDLKNTLRSITISAFGSQRLANAWRGITYPKLPKTSMGAAGTVHSNAPHIIEAFSNAVAVRSKAGFFLAIPSPDAPKEFQGKRVSPSNWNDARYGPLRFVYPLGTVVGASGVADTLLLNHGLPYVPTFMVVIGDTVISPGTIVQQDGSGVAVRTRTVTPYATATQIRLFETMLVNSTDLAAASVTYIVVVFKQPVAVDGASLFDKDGDVVTMAHGRFSSALKMLRHTGIAGDSPWDIALGPTLDISNGQRKEVTASGVVHVEPYYDGSFTGSPSFQGVIA